MRQKPGGFDTLDEVADAIATYQPHRARPSTLRGLAKNLRLGDDGRWRWHWDPGFLDIRTGGTSEHARDAHHDAPHGHYGPWGDVHPAQQ